MMKLKKWMAVLFGLLGLGLLVAAAALTINGYVICSTRDQILSPEEAQSYDADCILVLGCLVREDGTPSTMLHDRLQRSVALYQAGAAPKLLMSGDHAAADYDEVNAMKQFAVAAGIDSSDVFMDHAGFSTYESLYRAKEVFGVKKVIIVTQKYHLYRALYIADQLGLEAVGVAADYDRYGGQTYREIREFLARNKDFFTGIFQPKPTYLGEMIPIFGNGDLTNDS